MALTKVDLANTVEGILPVANGGTGSSSGVSPGGSTTQVQYNSSGALAGSSNLTFNGTTLTSAGFSGPLNGTVGATTPTTGVFTQVDTVAEGPVRWQDASGGQYVAFKAAATVASSVTWTLPSADGSNEIGRAHV